MRILFKKSKEGIKQIWEYYQTTDKESAITEALKLGWAEKRVQIRGTSTGVPGETLYSVEPFEDCGCPNLLRYEDYVNVGP